MGTPSEGARRFIEALTQAEAQKTPDPLLAVFRDDAEVWSAARPGARRGKRDVRAFWSEYLSAFERVRSEFKDVIAQDGHVALEWRTDAVLPGGAPLQYDGVTLLELDGDRVARFRTYFDPRPFSTRAGP